MISLYSGNDHVAIKKALSSVLEESRKDGSYRRHVGDLSIAMLDPYFSESLFGETYVVHLDGVSIFTEETKVFLVAQMRAMLDSGNHFILVDEKFSKEFKDEAKKLKIAINDHSQDAKETGLSVFTFTDLYLAKDKKGAWLSLTRLFRDGAAPEEVHGALFWAVKSLFLATNGSLGSSPEELGMKPYPYQKSKRFGAKWTNDEIMAALRELTHTLETTRKSGGDLAMSLERLVLL